MNINNKILITGANGFLGKQVVKKFTKEGYQNLITPTKDECDLTDIHQVQHLFTYSQPDIVIHLAAKVGGIGANKNNPATFINDNLLMGAYIIDASLKANVQKLTMVGTCCSYPANTPVPFKEEDLWNGYPEFTNAPYGIAKKTLLVQCQAYKKQHGLNAIYLIPANLYGPGDNFDLDTSHVIPAIIRKCTTAKAENQFRVELWGTGGVSREFLYVEDAAEAIFLATDKYENADPINIGTGREIKIKDLARYIGHLTEFKGFFSYNAGYPDGQIRRVLDTTKAREVLGFTAKTTLLDGLTKTINWYYDYEKSINNGDNGTSR